MYKTKESCGHDADLCIGSGLELVHHKLLVGGGLDHPLALFHHLVIAQSPVS